MAGTARGKLVEEWARDCIKVPLGWENINEFFTRPLFAKLAEKLAFAGDRGVSDYSSLIHNVCISVTLGNQTYY